MDCKKTFLKLFSVTILLVPGVVLAKGHPLIYGKFRTLTEYYINGTTLSPIAMYKDISSKEETKYIIAGSTIKNREIIKRKAVCRFGKQFPTLSTSYLNEQYRVVQRITSYKFRSIITMASLVGITPLTQAKPFYPHCVYKLLSIDHNINEISIKSCGKQKPYPKSKKKAGWYESDDPNVTKYGWFRFRYHQVFNNKAIVEINWSGGGSGTFSSIHLVELRKGKLKHVKSIVSGDRCSGGLGKAQKTKEGVIYNRHITALMMYKLAKPSPDKSKDIDLDDCRACCFAQAQYRYDLKSNKSKLLKIFLDRKKLFTRTPHFGREQTCFNDVYNEYLKTKKIWLSLKQLKLFVIKFHKKCTQ